MSTPLPLTGKAALVTGGTRGIGLAIARALCAAGADVAVLGRKPDTVDAAVAALGEGAGRSLGIAANVASADDRRAALDQTVERFGGLDILVNNAAANPVFGPVEDTAPEAFAKIMDVNVAAPFELAKLALPHLRASGRGAVLNISSIGGLRPEPKLGIYSVSKTALNGLTRVLAKEWGRYGIRVNAICPGLIQTDFSEALWSNDKLVAHFTAMTPLGRVGTPDDVAQLALALLSDAGAYVTGQIVTADGGYTV